MIVFGVMCWAFATGHWIVGGLLLLSLLFGGRSSSEQVQHPQQPIKPETHS